MNFENRPSYAVWSLYCEMVFHLTFYCTNVHHTYSDDIIIIYITFADRDTMKHEIKYHFKKKIQIVPFIIKNCAYIYIYNLDE